MNGKKLTTEQLILKTIALSCPLCGGKGQILKTKWLINKEYNLRYCVCPLCGGSGLKKGWGRESRRAVDKLI